MLATRREFAMMFIPLLLGPCALHDAGKYRVPFFHPSQDLPVIQSMMDFSLPDVNQNSNPNASIQ
jgi:hypothetical protein